MGIMEKNMETTILYSVTKGLYGGYIGIMEKSMDTAILYRVPTGFI